MSTSTANSSSNSSAGSHSGTQIIDNSIYIHELPHTQLDLIYEHLDQNGVWEEAARLMGYLDNDIFKFERESSDQQVKASEILISNWIDQNHTVTELFMVLYRTQQYMAMEVIKEHVDEAYHRLISKLIPKLSTLIPNFQTLMNSKSNDGKSNVKSGEILNGLAVGRDGNESSFTNTQGVSFNAKTINKSASAIPKFEYMELETATKNWSEKQILGRGGFGVVYKGIWKNTIVAIKRIQYRDAAKDPKRNAKIQVEQSVNELRYLNSCRHDNVLPLYGFSTDGSHPCLVYQYMAGGTLLNRLHGGRRFTEPLAFDQRKLIIVGTACGLQYLHTFMPETPLIHGDIKPANILLDPSCIPKIGDFGLVREGSLGSMEASTVAGTLAYLPQEFKRQKILSTKIDTYSYGIVLFEILTGLRAILGTDDKPVLLRNVLTKSINKESLMDESFEDNVDAYGKLFEVATKCVSEEADERPEMVDVLTKLEEFLPTDAR